MIDRMVGAARLDASAYQDVEHDRTATIQAAMVVTLAGAAAGFGQGYSASGPAAMLGAALLGAVHALVGWYVWALVSLFIGAKLFNAHADKGSMLRSLGFATAPLLFTVLGFVPILGWFIIRIAFVWVLVAGVVAVRQTLGLDTLRAVSTVIIGYIVQLVLLVFFGLIAYAIGLSPAAAS